MWLENELKLVVCMHAINRFLKKFGMKGAHPIIEENNNHNDSSEVNESTGKDTHNLL